MIEEKYYLSEKMTRIKANNARGHYDFLLGGVIDLNYVSSKTRRGRVQEQGKVSPTICAENPELCRWEETDMGYRIRKLTEKECWRLMDFTDDDFEKARAVNSATQCYKQAGNSIVVNVLVGIFGQMVKGKEDEYKKEQK